MELENLPWYGQFLVFLLIGAVLFAFFYFLYYSPKSEQIKTIISKSEELEKEIRIAERNESRLRKLEEEIMSNENTLEQLKTILPDKKEVDQILRKIQALCSTTRLRLNDINPQSTRQKEIYEEWPFNLSVEGNYHNLAIFFDQLSRLTKIFNIDTLDIKPIDKMTDEYTVKATFYATTYIYHEIEVAKPKPKPRTPRQATPEDKIQDNVGIRP